MMQQMSLEQLTLNLLEQEGNGEPVIKYALRAAFAQAQLQFQQQEMEKLKQQVEAQGPETNESDGQVGEPSTEGQPAKLVGVKK